MKQRDLLCSFKEYAQLLVPSKMLQVPDSAWEEALNASQVYEFKRIPMLSISWLHMSPCTVCRYSGTLLWDRLQKLVRDPKGLILVSVICLRRHAVCKPDSVEFSTNMKIWKFISPLRSVTNFFHACLLIETVFCWIMCKQFTWLLIGIIKTHVFLVKFQRLWWCWNNVLNLKLHIQLTTHYTV